MRSINSLFRLLVTSLRMQLWSPLAAVKKETSVDKSWEELRLPPGYQLELDPDTLVLRRPDGSAVAVFSKRGVVPEHIEATAWEDAAGGQGGDGPQVQEEPPQRD
jgi:hypothetical protein